ncbi:MAG: zinc-ribbon domain-containing protein [Cellulosilyticaceae bacterium]
MAKVYICPDCHHEIKPTYACGNTGYFCEHCKKLISSKKVIIEENK